MTSTNGLSSGIWAQWDTCPTGSLVQGLQLKVESDQGAYSDDSAVNALHLFCRYPEDATFDAAVISSESGYEGTWESIHYCPPNYWLVSFRLLVQPSQGTSDDTGVNNIEMLCRGSGLTRLDPYVVRGDGVQHIGASYGSWPSNSCLSGSAICSLRVRIDESSEDIKGITDIEMKCCEH